MTWFNEPEVYVLVHRYGGDPILGPAVRNLNRLVNITNYNSDGWPYFKKPGRSATKLSNIIHRVDVERAGYSPGEGLVTAKEIAKASTPIKAFLTRQGWWEKFGAWEESK